MNDNISDIITEKKVLTFKSGQFVFSAKYSENEVKDLFINSVLLYALVSEIPILPDLASKIEDELILKSIFSTAAIEGNSLNEERVKELLSNKTQTEPGKNKKNETEIANLKEAYTYIKTLPVQKDGFIFTEEIVRHIHLLVTQNIDYKDNTPGNYRNHLVKVGDPEHGGVDVPPKTYEDIKMLTDEFIKWINSEEAKKANPVIRAALAHFYLARIHPFGDGNGRTSRLIEALFLFQAGIKYIPVMLSNYYYYHLDDYFRAFSSAINNKDNDITDFISFVLKGHIESQNVIKSRIFFYIRMFTLKDYYSFMFKEKKITQRELDLLSQLLILQKEFTLKEINEISGLDIIYRDISERTIRRDLDKLLEMNLLIKKVDKYLLNMNVLG
ncbi:MAG: Fic family protein [Elusimicrobia bacterium]|nr:Fic family protein [Candidatus Liberimonas magnetica]